MAILTKEQKDKYMAGGASVCPFCGSFEISGHALEMESGEVWQNVFCGDCGQEWRDVYALAYVETDEELKTPAVPA